MNKHIVCTVTNDLSYDQRMIRICSTLVDAGHTVTLVGRRLPTSSELWEMPFNQYRINCAFKKGPLFYLEYNLRLLGYFIQSRPEVINSVDLDTVIAAWLYKLLARFIWTYDAHEYFTEVPEVTNRKWVKRTWLRAEKMVFANADAFYTVSQSIAKLFSSHYQKTVKTIRNVPFYRSLKYKKSQKSKPILIYQGALNEGRCIEHYIKAMHHVDAELWLVGDGDLTQQLKELSRTEQLTKQVIFKGRVSPSDLHQLTLQADIGLNVLEHKGLSYYYSLSNKCFDYIQCGIPALASDFPEYQQINSEHETMLLVEANTEAIAAGIKELLSNNVLYEKLHNNCTVASGVYHWDNEKIKLLSIYA